MCFFEEGLQHLSQEEVQRVIFSPRKLVLDSIIWLKVRNYIKGKAACGFRKTGFRVQYHYTQYKGIHSGDSASSPIVLYQSDALMSQEHICWLKAFEEMTHIRYLNIEQDLLGVLPTANN